MNGYYESLDESEVRDFAEYVDANVVLSEITGKDTNDMDFDEAINVLTDTLLDMDICDSFYYIRKYASVYRLDGFERFGTYQND